MAFARTAPRCGFIFQLTAASRFRTNSSYIPFPSRSLADVATAPRASPSGSPPSSSTPRNSSAPRSSQPSIPLRPPTSDASPSLTGTSDWLRQLSAFHSNPARTVEQRRCLDQLHSAYTAQPPSLPPILTISHMPLLMKAALCCHHPTIALWLLHTFYPPPLSLPSSSTPWPRAFELAFECITSTKQSRQAHASTPQQLDDFLHLLSQHHHPVLPSMLTPALLFYRHHEAWQSMLRLHEHCTAQSVPIIKTAYPLFLVALNHTGQWQAALTLLDDAESTLRPHTPLHDMYPIFHATMHALGTSEQSDIALDVYQRMRTGGMPPKQETFAAILNALAKPAQDNSRVSVQTVQQLQAEMEQAGVAVNQPLYRALIRAYLRFGAFDRVMPLLQRFVQLHHDALSHFFVLSVCLELEDVDAALLMMDKVRQRMEAAQGSSPQAMEKQTAWTMYTSVYNRVLDLCVRMRQWKAVKRVWDMRHTLHVQPNVISLYLVAHALKPQSASWSKLLDSALPMLSVQSTASVLSLDMRTAESSVVAMASLWWALKAVQAATEGFAQRELVVQVGEWKGVERLVREELGLVPGRWQQPGVVSWTRQSLDAWGRAQAVAAPQQQQTQPRLALGLGPASAVDSYVAEERRGEQAAAVELSAAPPAVSEEAQREDEADGVGVFGFGLVVA